MLRERGFFCFTIRELFVILEKRFEGRAFLERFISKSEEQTIQVAKYLAKRLEKGSVILLLGDLGAGKTLFANAFARELGITEHLLSPTFTIAREYEGLYHFDLYRIDDEEELFEIGFDEYLNSGNFCLIEWADKFPHLFCASAVKVHINYIDEGREILIEG